MIYKIESTMVPVQDQFDKVVTDSGKEVKLEDSSINEIVDQIDFDPSELYSLKVNDQVVYKGFINNVLVYARGQNLKNDEKFEIVNDNDKSVAKADSYKDLLSKLGYKEESARFDLGLKENKFKDYHICQGCGKPLSQCTCQVKEEESLDEDLDSSDDEVDITDYEYCGNKSGYQTYRKIITTSDGKRKGIWAAQDQDKKHPPFRITYNQALGYDPIDKYDSEVQKLSRELGRMLLPRREGKVVKESYYKIAGYYPGSPEDGISGDKFETFAVVKADSLEDAKEKFRQIAIEDGDERVSYFKDFDDYLDDADLYVDSATKEEYDEYTNYEGYMDESLHTYSFYARMPGAPYDEMIDQCTADSYEEAERIFSKSYNTKGGYIVDDDESDFDLSTIYGNDPDLPFESVKKESYEVHIDLGSREQVETYDNKEDAQKRVDELNSLKKKPSMRGMKVKMITNNNESLKEGYDDLLTDDEIYVEDEESDWVEIDHKMVYDSDGFTTDYTWYHNDDTGNNVFVFGDRDLYRPEDGYYDFETEDNQEAQDWFDNYSTDDDDYDFGEYNDDFPWEDESLKKESVDSYNKIYDQVGLVIDHLTYGEEVNKENISVDDIIEELEDYTTDERVDDPSRYDQWVKDVERAFNQQMYEEESLKESFGSWSDWNLNCDITDDDREVYRNWLGDYSSDFDSLSDFQQELLVAENKENGLFWEVFDGDEGMIDKINDLKDRVGTSNRYDEPHYDRSNDDEEFAKSMGYDSYDDYLKSWNDRVKKQDAGEFDESLNTEDTVRKSNGKWTNRGKDGEHGEFDTKKQADAQRKAMYANGYKGESLDWEDYRSPESDGGRRYYLLKDGDSTLATIEYHDNDGDPYYSAFTKNKNGRYHSINLKKFSHGRIDDVKDYVEKYVDHLSSDDRQVEELILEIKDCNKKLRERFSTSDIDSIDQKIKDMKIGDSVEVKNYKNGEIYKFVKRSNNNTISSFENVLGKNHLASPDQVFGWSKDSLIYADYPPKFRESLVLEIKDPDAKEVKTDLSKRKGSITQILTDNREELGKSVTKNDLIATVKDLFKKNNLDTPASRKLIVNMTNKKSLTGALEVMWNTMLKGSGLGVINSSIKREDYYDNDGFSGPYSYDGWNVVAFQDVLGVLNQLEEVRYEIENGQRGALTGKSDLDSLLGYIDELSSVLKNAVENFPDYEEESIKKESMNDKFYSHYRNKIKSWSTMAGIPDIREWLINDLKDLEDKSLSHNWGWDFSDGVESIADDLIDKAKKEFDWLHESSSKKESVEDNIYDMITDAADALDALDDDLKDDASDSIDKAIEDGESAKDGLSEDVTSGATNPSNVGQHKVDSIDLVEDGEMKLYKYQGPIYKRDNGTKVADSETLYTKATSEKKAYNNLSFRLKKKGQELAGHEYMSVEEKKEDDQVHSEEFQFTCPVCKEKFTSNEKFSKCPGCQSKLRINDVGGTEEVVD